MIFEHDRKDDFLTQTNKREIKSKASIIQALMRTKLCPKLQVERRYPSSYKVKREGGGRLAIEEISAKINS